MGQSELFENTCPFGQVFAAMGPVYRWPFPAASTRGNVPHVGGHEICFVVRMTTYTHRLKAIDSGFYAQCCEMDHAAAEGDTAEETVASLRKAIAERLAENEGMAPPSVKPLLPAFSLVEAAPPEGPSSPQGPGEAT